MLEPFHQTVKTRKELWMDPPTSETMEAPNANSIVGNHGRENASVAADIEDLINHYEATNTATATSSKDIKRHEKQQKGNVGSVMNDLERLFKLYDKQPNDESLSEKSNNGHRDTPDRLPRTSEPVRTTGREQQGWRPNDADRPAKKQRKPGGGVDPTGRCR